MKSKNNFHFSRKNFLNIKKNVLQNLALKPENLCLRSLKMFFFIRHLIIYFLWLIMAENPSFYFIDSNFFGTKLNLETETEFILLRLFF